MNLVVLQGNLTKDMEITKSEGTSIARGSLALDRGKDSDGNSRGADYPNIVAFGKRADFFERFGKKGRRFLIEGHIKTGSYTNKDGVKIYTTDVIVDRVEFADSKSAGQEQPAGSAPDPNAFMTIPDGDIESLPFD